MKFSETHLKGLFVTELEPIADSRGFFARSFCQHEFDELGLNSDVAQINISHNKQAGTFRGFHYQLPPAAETKVLRCTKGAILDIAVDVRAGSETFGDHFAVELSADNHMSIYIPDGFAHGYLTLTDDTEVTYSVSEFYTPNQERGIRYDDPMLNIDWPRSIDVISEKDRGWPDFAGENV